MLLSSLRYAEALKESDVDVTDCGDRMDRTVYEVVSPDVADVATGVDSFVCHVAVLNCHLLDSLPYCLWCVMDRNWLHASVLDGVLCGAVVTSYGSIDGFHSSCYAVWYH